MHIPKHSLSLRVRRLNSIRQPNTEQFQGDSIPSVNPTRSERNKLLLPPRSWRLERGLTRAHHRIIGTMQAHLRSCIVPENNSWLWWMLAVRAAQIQEAFCACDFGSHCPRAVRTRSLKSCSFWPLGAPALSFNKCVDTAKLSRADSFTFEAGAKRCV